MIERYKSVLRHGVTIRGYIALWGGSVLLACLVLVVGWLLAQRQLSQMQGRTFTDAQALDLGRLLEIQLLTERSEDLLWRATGHEQHRTQRDARLDEAAKTANELRDYIGSPEEVQLVEQINQKLTAFRALAAHETPATLEQVSDAVDDLLRSVEQYQDQNRAQMADTFEGARRLQVTIDRSSIILVLFVGVILVVGSIGLIQRVARPTLEVSRAAREFGSGNLAARASVEKDDELGSLSRTFNNMAEDIASREKSRLDFVASVAHDLKNPLVTIGGAARKLRSGSRDPAQIAWLDRMILQVTRLENLAQDLMDTVQVSTGRLSLNTTRLNLTELIREIQQEQGELFSSHTLAFEGEEDCWVLADKGRIERVAINLISNAVKYSPEGTQVLLRVCRERTSAVLFVKDRGVGISAEDLAVIFQPFGRGRHTRHMAKGTGLGLCVVKDIIEAHGGGIHIDSAPGAGTSVEIRLPLESDNDGSSSAKES